MLVPIRMGSNMAAGNQQKHVTQFCYKSVNLSLEELKKRINNTLSNKRTAQIAKFWCLSLINKS